MQDYPSPSQPPNSPGLDIMDIPSLLTAEDPSSYSSDQWDWGDLFDFPLDHHLPPSLPSDQSQLSHPPPHPPPPPPPLSHPPPPPPASAKIRKRDPRLTCINFLEGCIPCSCPPIDENLENQELPTKKRVRSARAGSGACRCQVPGCEADISELKGYHRRHKVCLRCANASSIVLFGETKRYCQQCGKFHVLLDFDDGKRSCRRKLERHNNRRRRKPSDTLADAKGVTEKEQQALLNEGITVDGEYGKDNASLSDQMADQDASLAFENRHVSALRSAPVNESNNTDSVISFLASGGTQMNEGRNDLKRDVSPSCCDNKSAYSSACPTGRISFKLYDWNPAEFPRRLRHQIFQWLANMPVELEGYVRPGCTILTVFIAMPEIMWAKLREDPLTYLHDFIIKPGKILSGKGSITVYLNNLIFRVIKSGTSIKEVNVKLQAPRLRYVYPICFEAGKPIEFVACGNNLLQPKFRFLVSFAGKYLPHEYSFASSHGPSGKESPSCENELCKIFIGPSDSNQLGPAFVEVENESGLSNFIPLIIGDEAICSEMKLIEHRFGASLFHEEHQTVACDCQTCSCKDFEPRQAAFSGLLLDIAWSVKVPMSDCNEQTMNCCQVKRYNRVLSFLLQSEFTAILAKVLQNLRILVERMGLDNLIDCTCDTDVRLLVQNMKLARELQQKCLDDKNSTSSSEEDPPLNRFRPQISFQNGIPSSISTTNQDLETGIKVNVGMDDTSTAYGRSENDSLLNRGVVLNLSHDKEWPGKSIRKMCYTGAAVSCRPTVVLVATAIVCFAVCAVIYHPQKIAEFSVFVRRRLTGKF